MRRLVKAKVFNSRGLKFERPLGLQAVFDGHCEIMDYTILEDCIRLKSPPAFEVMFLVAA